MNCRLMIADLNTLLYSFGLLESSYRETLLTCIKILESNPQLYKARIEVDARMQEYVSRGLDIERYAEDRVKNNIAYMIKDKVKLEYHSSMWGDYIEGQVWVGCEEIEPEIHPITTNDTNWINGDNLNLDRKDME